MNTIARLDESLYTIGEFVEFPPELSGGRNLVISSNDFSKFSGYFSSISEVVDTNVIVEEWGANDASRLIVTGGTSLLKTTPYIRGGDFSEVFTYSFWMKNNGDTPVTLRFNGFTTITRNRDFTFQPNESGKFIITGRMRDAYDWFQHQLHTEEVEHNVDVTLWRSKLEYGTKVTPWTPAPEDLGLVYPSWVKNFNTSFSENGVITGELVEYPEELKGRRNLFKQSDYSHHSNVGYNPSIVTSAVVKVEPNTAYTISYTVTDTNRFGVWHDTLPDGIYAKRSDDAVEIEPYMQTEIGEEVKKTITTSSISNGYLTIYLSNLKGNAREPNLKVEKGLDSTLYTPAPEDLGLVYPPNITSFSTNLKNSGITVKRLIEFPTPLGGNNLIPNSHIAKSSSSYSAYSFDSQLLSDHIGKYATISFDAKTVDDGQEGYVDTYLRGTGILGSSSNPFKVDNEEKRYNFSFILQEVSLQALTVAIRSNQFVAGNTSGVLVEVRNVKLEIGSTATPWSPALEDLGIY